eukprot:m.1211019 g.1211019  ORF g.1211019 m.1211019 type:complete len:137 (+) comp24593_c1_seq17:193-603(+)
MDAGIVDKIFTRVSSQENITGGLSMFAIDLQKVTEAVKYSTRSSLVILDEFGKGTMSVDGVSTFCAVLNEFMNRKEDCPTVLLSSHFHEIFSKNLIPTCSFMEYKTTQTVLNDGSEMVSSRHWCSGCCLQLNADLT